MNQASEFGGEIIVPASTSNLGPGFDALSVALRLYTRVQVTDVRPSAPDTLETVFIDGPFRGENRIERAYRLARARFGVPVPGLRIEVRSDVPRQAGLGSSAAAAVAGFRLYEALTSRRAALEWLPLACEIEGHPDNAAAALLGGITTSCQHEDGRVTAHAWPWPALLRFVVATPHVPLATAQARRVLPQTVPLRDAVYNLQRALLLIRVLETGRYDELREALRDRWHQPFRAPLVPVLAEALALDHPAVLGVYLSGAGPSIVALSAGREEEVAAVLAALYDRVGVPCTIRTLDAHQPGGVGGI